MSSRDEFLVKSFRFVVAGGLSTAVLYLLYAGLVYAGMPYNAALTIEYALGITASYFWQRHWTFATHGRPRLGFLKYCATFVFIFAFNAILLNALVRGAGFGPIFGQFLSLSVVTVASFLLQNFWVFRPAEPVRAGQAGGNTGNRPR